MRIKASPFGSLILLLVLVASVAGAADAPTTQRQAGTPSAVRDAPGPAFLAYHDLHLDARGHYRMRLERRPATAAREAVTRQSTELTHTTNANPHRAWSLSKTSATLNCDNDNMPDPATTLVLNAGDAVGTIFYPVPGLGALVVDTVRFGAIDFGASYPGTMAVDFWQVLDDGDLEFVAGGDVPILTDPGLGGATYEFDMSALEIVTNNEMMVLLYDANPGAGLILPAGDSSPSCFNGVDYCSVILPAGGASLYLYGLVDATACPDTQSQIQLFDIVVEVDYFVDSPTDAPSRVAGFALHDAVPNPFNPRVSIRYSIPEACAVSLMIYDLAGRVVRTLVAAPRDVGEHVAQWDGRAQDNAVVASGVYLYRLETATFTETKRMVLLR